MPRPKKMPSSGPTLDVTDPGEKVGMSIRIEKTLHERLRKLAFDQRISMQEFIVRGIEEVLKAEKY